MSKSTHKIPTHRTGKLPEHGVRFNRRGEATFPWFRVGCDLGNGRGLSAFVSTMADVARRQGRAA